MREKLCNTFSYISGYVWNLLRDSQYYGLYQTSRNNISRGLGLSEETISDLILLKISKKQPYDIITVKFGKNYERQEGADWEWWVLSQSGIIGLRLQAKRIHFNNNSYEYTHLDYRRRNSNQYQADILIQQAQNRGMIPIYMFFNWWDLAYPFRRYINRNIPQCCRVYSYRKLGTTIASGWIIRNAVYNNQKSLSDILPLSYPIHCLFCCQYSDLTESISKFFKYIIKEETNIKIRDKLPENVYFRLKGKFDDASPTYTSFILDRDSPHDESSKIKEMIR